MKKTMLAVVLVLALAAVYSMAQTSGSSGTPAPQGGSSATGTPQTGSTGAPGQQPGSAPAPGDQNRAQDRQGKADNQASAVDNEQLSRQVRQQLSDPVFANVQASIEEDGKVMLEGTVASKDDRKRAKELVKAVPGVRKVKENLKVEASAAATSPSTGTTTSTPPSSSTMTGSASGTTGGATSSTPQTSGTGVSGSGTASGSTQTTGGVSGSATTTPSQPQTSGSTTGTAGASGSIAGSTQSGTTSGTQSTTTGTQGSASTGTAAGAQGSAGTAAAPSELQGRIQHALQRENLSGVTVMVSGNIIELTGSLPTGKEKQMAKRIAQSFAGNMKVNDRITVTGLGQGQNMEKGTMPPPADNPNQQNPSKQQQPANPR